MKKNARDAILEALVYPWAIPSAYRLAALLSRVRGWLRG
jgi:hypothetical protein